MTTNTTPKTGLEIFKMIARKILYLFAIFASIVLIIDITLVDIPNIQNNTLIRNNNLQFWICIYFLLDLLSGFFLSDHRLEYFRRYLFLILVSIPYINVLNHFHLELSTQAFYLLKFLPIFRGVIALFLLVKLLISDRITGLFVSYLTLFFSIAYLQTLLFYLFEISVNPQVKTYGDVLWWASMTATTLGSNIIPITTAGKISTAILAVAGITIFPIFTVYITTMIQNLSKKHTDESSK
ncbi:two pore domain potassium channel family protein [Wohlfahrtiimonas chitiniclastica]|uniref:ion channel n=1 Tax=Wohlfahrtiimonas chitiniclastica TaxID=400946 RepID=UPI001BCB2E17|nr:ion channel [Wohlfahrtiimonas chitiniclastica]MBS7819953.1 two pore domain potassium channel family protein [Wohlfahrtiimonas chitiniclastica]